jgi:putative endonuclease
MGERDDRRRRSERAGRTAELLIAAAYALQGYSIVARRFRTPVGEVDFIARRGGVVAFVEVKLRRDGDSAILAVTPRLRRRVEKAAASFLALRPQFARFAVRYDIAAVAGLRVRLIKDAWRASARP